MSPSTKDTVSKKTLFIRYGALTMMTLGLIAMIGTSCWLIGKYVGYMNIFPGYITDGMSDFGYYRGVPAIRNNGGVVLYRVEPNTAAEKAGLRAADSIVSINGVRLQTEPQAFIKPYLDAKLGDELQIEFFRNSILRHATIVLEDYKRARALQGNLGITSAWIGHETSKDQAKPSPSGLRILSVAAGSPADSVGIVPNDLILRINGEVITSDTQSTRLIASSKPGSMVEIDLSRHGTPFHTVAIAVGKYQSVTYLYGFAVRGTAEWTIWLTYLPHVFTQFLLMGVGAFIGYFKPRNTVAFICSFFFLGASAAAFNEATPLLAAIPAGLETFLFMLMELMSGLALVWVIRLFSIFPGSSRLGSLFLRWQWLAWAFFALYSTITCAYWIALFYSLKLPWLLSNPITQLFVNAPWLGILIFFVMLVLLVAQRVEARRAPRNRMKIVELSFLLAAIGGILYFVMYFIENILPADFASYFRLVCVVLTYASFIGMPLLFTYSVIANKVFDIRFIIRKGLRYLLLSKGALVIEGVIVFLIVLQVVTHGGENIIGSPFAVSSLSVGSTLAVMFTLGKVNRMLMPAIDRRFFREALDVRKLLLEHGEQLSQLREQQQILQRTAHIVLRTLHPQRVVFLMKDAQEFRSVCAVENTTHGEIEPEIPTSVRLGHPVTERLEDGAWVLIPLEALNPEIEDDRQLSMVNCELLIAIRGSAGLVGVMGLGGKLSEEPYSKEDRDLLMTVAREMGMALENAELLEVAKREAEFSKELDIARQVQQNLFPKQLPTPSGWDFAGICKPAKAVGGDYYDIFEPVPGKIVVALGDVSGKGLGASFVMSGVHSTIRTRSQKSSNNLVELVEVLNAYLLSSTSAKMFVTMFIGVIDLQTGLLRYVNCGHPPALVVSPDRGKLNRLTRTGLALGMMKGVEFQQNELTMNAGDSLVIYSDGVTEAMNEREELYEEERLVEVVSSESKVGAQPMMDAILESADAFAGVHEQADDISVIIVRRLKSIL